MNQGNTHTLGKNHNDHHHHLWSKCFPFLQGGVHTNNNKTKKHHFCKTGGRVPRNKAQTVNAHQPKSTTRLPTLEEKTHSCLEKYTLLSSLSLSIVITTRKNTHTHTHYSRCARQVTRQPIRVHGEDSMRCACAWIQPRVPRHHSAPRGLPP